MAAGRFDLTISTFVETGTNKGETSVWASGVFDRVVTIEASELLYRAAVKQYHGIGNIEFLFGDCRLRLVDVVASLTSPALFWLDAHWCGNSTFGKSAECPVLDELSAINSSAHGHVILIDDARLFLAPPPPPHEADHWPTIANICETLDRGTAKRHISVFRDVIVAVPSTFRHCVVDFLRAAAIDGPAGSLHNSRGKPARWISV